MKKSVLVALVSILLGSPLMADWVYLKNGSKIQGKVTKRENGKVHLDLPNGTLRIRSSRIERIETETDRSYKLNQARRKRHFGAYDQSLSFLEGLLSERPSSTNVRKELKTTLRSAARSAFQKSQISKARNLVDRGLEQFPSSVSLQELSRKLNTYRNKTDDLLQEASKLHRAKNVEKAIELYERVLERSPGRADRVSGRLAGAYAEAGKVAHRNKKFNRAISYFESCVQYAPD